MICAIQGCGAKLMRHNRSGHCRAHHKYSDAYAKQQAAYGRKPGRKEARKASVRAYDARNRRPCPQPGCERLINRGAVLCASHASLAGWARRKEAQQ